MRAKSKETSRECEKTDKNLLLSVRNKEIFSRTEGDKELFSHSCTWKSRTWKRKMGEELQSSSKHEKQSDNVF